MFEFEPAVRVAEHARICLDGLPGAPTLPVALRLARGLVGADGVIGVVDTQRGAAARLADEHDFLHLRVDSCSPKEMPKITAAATAARVDVLIVDTFTSFWSGKDGMLMLVDQHRKSATQSGWSEARPHEQAMMEALLDYPGHVITTLRVKSDMAIGADHAGRPVGWKVALKPDHRDGLEYEFHLAATIGLDGSLTVTSTCVEGVADFEIGAIEQQPGEEYGQALAEWVGQGEQLPTLRDYLDRAAAPGVTSAELLAAAEEAEARGMGGLTVRDKRGQLGPLFGLLTARAKWLAGKEQRTAQQAPPAAPSAPPAAPDTTGLTPPGEGIPEFVPDDRALIAEMTLRIAHVQEFDLVEGIQRDLDDLRASNGASQSDLSHLWRLLEKRRVKLGFPHGQPSTPAQSEGAAT
ncbi:AAA family ATPase [Streptosporangium sp. NPDC048865]|uniref:AAA family ATPase n=1 Tax=Streptosporangium sp. NPDC048865 TaxID=3155766 RepID=UPI003444209A